MPVAGMVQYDCNVSMRENPYGGSTTIIVELPDGMERYPKELENHLFKGVLRRLKVEAHEMRSSRGYPSVLTYLLSITTDRGYHLGSLKMSAPHSTGWRSDTVVNLAENYFPTEIEGYIEQALRHHLVIRLNQRMPPLPRTEPDEEGQRGDLFSGSLFPDEREFEELKTQIRESVLRRSDSVTYATYQRAQHEEMMLRRRQDELVMRQIMGAAVPMPIPEGLRFPGGTDEGRDVAAPPFPGGVYQPKDVAKRADESSRLDVASRGGTQARDVAEMGTELDL